jgi:acetolactate synthase-1/2/3 large subunit
LHDVIIAGRRSLLKGSLALGASVALRPAVADPAILPEQTAKPPALPPLGAQAHAEAGLVGQESPADPSPLPSEQIIRHPGSDYMVDLLRAANIKYVAAMVGSTFRGLHESIVNYGGNQAPELIVCVHEEISAAAAHGYAKVAGRPMACLVHSTVGLQHASMAIYNAWCDRAPIIVLAGNGLDATKRRPGAEWFHSAADLGAFVRDFVKWDDTPVSLAHYGESFMRAMQLAMTPPYEPVMLVVDSELQEDPIANRESLSVPRLTQVAPPAGDPIAIERIAALLVAASSPLIVVDRVSRTQDDVRLLVHLAELLNAPVVDRGGRMNMPTNHYLNQTSAAGGLIKGADVILGLELTDIWGIVNNVPDKIQRKSVRIARDDAKIIGVSANYAFMHSNVQDQQRYYACDITLAADAATTLPQLIDAVTRHVTSLRGHVIAARKPALVSGFSRMRAKDAEAAAVGWHASPVSTARLSMEIWQRIKSLNWALVSNTAFISSWPQRLWDITESYQYIGGEGGYGVGYGLPAAFGAALAHRDAGRIPVAIQTDGDAIMLPGSLWSFAHHNVPILIVMHNNRAWHQESMHLKRMSSRRDRGPETWPIGTTLTGPDIDFAGLARSMGVWSEGPIDDPDQLGNALDRALDVVKQGKPALLDVLTQPR